MIAFLVASFTLIAVLFAMHGIRTLFGYTL
jgi:hypothetical protein